MASLDTGARPTLTGRHHVYPVWLLTMFGFGMVLAACGVMGLVSVIVSRSPVSGVASSGVLGLGLLTMGLTVKVGRGYR